MRIFDVVKTPGINIGTGGGNFSIVELAVNGPSYQITAQSQIWQLKFAHAHFDLTAASVAMNNILVADAWQHDIVNANKGADKRLRFALEHFVEIAVGGFAEGGIGIGVNTGLGVFVPATWTVGFDTKNADVRGDDFPNLGGVQITKPASGEFSLKLVFNYTFGLTAQAAPGGGDITFDHTFDVLADLSDYSDAVQRRI